jgi:hypothetical protein
VNNPTNDQLISQSTVAPEFGAGMSAREIKAPFVTRVKATNKAIHSPGRRMKISVARITW